MEELRGGVSTLPRRAEYEEEVSLLEYATVLWQYRLIVLAVVVLAAVIMLLIDWNRPAIYQASSRLLVSAPRIGDTAPPVSIGTYQAMVSSQSLVADTIAELQLSSPPHNLSVSEALQGHVTVQAIPDTQVIVVTTRLGDPLLAARFANRLAERAVELARQTSQQDTVAARDTIKLQLDDTRTRLDETERRLEAYQREARMEILEADVSAILWQRGRLLPLLIETESERARGRQLAEELSRHESVRDVRGTVVPGTTPTQPAGTMNPEVNFRQDVLNPFVNPTHEVLEQQLAASRTKLAALEKERAEIARSTNLSDAAAKRLHELYSRRVELERLRIDLELARNAYKDVSSRYEQARLQVAGRSAQLQVIDNAVPPETPIAPRILRDTVAAVAVSAVLASAVLLLLAALGRDRARRAG